MDRTDPPWVLSKTTLENDQDKGKPKKSQVSIESRFDISLTNIGRFGCKAFLTCGLVIENSVHHTSLPFVLKASSQSEP